MPKAIRAVFIGGVIKPLEKVDLPEGVEVAVIVLDAPVPKEELNFASWPLGVKGQLSREEIYDHL